MPGHPDPRTNLAMTLERAGQIDSAMDEYRSALEVWPDYMPAVQAYARCQVKNGVPQEDLPQLVELIAIRGETEEWRRWGHAELSRRAP